MVLDDRELISIIEKYISPYFLSHNDLGDLFEIDSIKLELGIPEEEVKTTIANTKQLSTEEKDKLTDIPDNSENYMSTKSKAKIEYNENFYLQNLIVIL